MDWDHGPMGSESAETISYFWETGPRGLNELEIFPIFGTMDPGVYLGWDHGYRGLNGLGAHGSRGMNGLGARSPEV